MKPLLAIVIPYYKIDFFEETIKSVAEQTNKNFTLYIGNDASPHDPLPLIQKYFPAGNYQYFSYEENLGGRNLAMQWERILDNVNEEWFQILGDDDVISENFVEEFYSAQQDAHHHQSNVIKFSQCWIDQDSKQLNELTHYPKISPVKDIWRAKFISYHRSSLSEHVFRRTSYLQYKFKHFPLAWHTDDYAVLQYSQNRVIIFCNEAKVYVRISDLNISSQTDDGDIKEIAQHLFLENLLNNHLYLFSKNDLLKYLDQYLHLTWKRKFESGVNLYKIYWRIKPFYKIIKVPFINYQLRKHCNAN